MKYFVFFALCFALNCWSAVTVSPVADGADTNDLASIENEYLKLSFVAATRGGQPSARPVVKIRADSGWAETPLDPSAESYQVLSAPPGVNLETTISGFYPRWTDSSKTKVGFSQVIWNTGTNHEAIIASVTKMDAHRLRLRFYPLAVGKLEAIWSLAQGEKAIKVALEFIPARDGQYSLGYFLFNRKPIGEVDEVLMPMLVQRKRFPAKEYTLLQTQCPTPMSLMQLGAFVLAVSGDRTSTPFEFPVPAQSRYGLHIRNPQGQVQPSIYGPLIGTPDARARSGQPIRFTFRVLAQSGDWYAGYRTVADEVFGWHDYRRNGAVSLTQAALNMIDLYMDDEHGGWWDRAKAPCQVESKNGSTLSSPLTAVSLYCLTGDTNLYQRRTLPTLEFLLSRDGPHFSPIPENTGGYAKGSMNGPVNIFGATVYAGLWEMMNRRTPVFHDIAFPRGGVRMTTTQQNFETHNQPFDEWLGRYLFTGDKAALERAIREADSYIAEAVNTPPTRELGTSPFFLMPFTPAWEGLLRLYEVTQERRFLDAATKGAHIVMTGMWTQPTPAAGDVTIHPGGFCHGDKLHLLLHKGEEEFRLGWPRKEGDTPERVAPAWMVSNVGLGFEQPTTYTYKDNGGRLIFQAPWASGFLRLAQYTGDRQFETYARNATLGRWGNYPGYYYTTFTDLMQHPRYPYEGPDVSFVYYHHIPVHLSWTLDYLVSEALLRSAGEIRFPSVRQFGYAYFDNLVYGHEPGRIFGTEGAWLWLRKGLVTLDNPQINYLMAHTQDKFFLILMNESSQQETVALTFHPENITKGSGYFGAARVISGGGGEVPLTENAGKISLTPRGFTVLQVDGLNIEVPGHRIYPPPASRQPRGFVKVVAEDVEVRAAAIQREPGPWEAYVWCTAGSGTLKVISLAWSTGEQSGAVKDVEYPYEFSIPVPRGHTNFSFSLSGLKADGARFIIPETNIGASEVAGEARPIGR